MSDIRIARTGESQTGENQMYNKLFTKILDSSIWLESVGTRLVWLTMLAAMDEDGFVQFASVANLAHRARVELADAEEAVRCLESPDPNSSDPDNDGRRIERVPGGWMVLNSPKYRDMVKRVVIKEQTRSRVARFREKKRGCNAHVTETNASVTQSDTDTPTETNTTKPPNPQRGNGQAKAGTPVSENAKRLAAIFHRAPTTQWTANEVRAFKRLIISEEDLNSLELYYSSSWPPCRDKNILRHDLSTLLNNFAGEVDRAKMWAAKQSTGFKKSESAAKREDRFEDPMEALVRKTLEEAK